MKWECVPAGSVSDNHFTYYWYSGVTCLSVFLVSVVSHYCGVSTLWLISIYSI